MPTVVFQVVLPLYALVAMATMAMRRLAVRRKTGIEPLALHPLRAPTNATTHVERVLALGTVALNADIVANAVAPGLMADWLAVPLLRESLVLGWIGLTMLTGGLALDLVGVFGMGGSWRVGIDHEHPGALVTSGVYSRIRHPIYAGVMLMACGLAIITADVISIAVGAAALVGLPVLAHLEEEFLAGRYGATYVAYCQRTRRF